MPDKTKRTTPTTVPEETTFTPTEEQILREMKQQEKRKQYQTSEKAIINRKKYMTKHYAEVKANRDAVKNLKETDPVKYAELMAKVKNDLIADK